MASRRAVVGLVLILAAGASGSTLAQGAPARDDANELAALQLVVPVVGVRRSAVHDTYAERRGQRPHEAIDIPAAQGTPVVAAAAGRIVKLFHSIPGGLTIYQFDRGERFALYYAHLQGYAPGVREGLHVTRGQVIGYVGTTGNAPPNAPHLHFAIFRLGPEKRWWQGAPVDPFAFLHDP